MKFSFKQSYIEPLIYTIIWLLIVLVVLFISQTDDDFSLPRSLYLLVWFVPFFAIFLVNNTYLVPHLLFKKKYFIYFAIITAMILLISHPVVTKFLHELISPGDASDQLPPPRRPGFDPGLHGGHPGAEGGHPDQIEHPDFPDRPGPHGRRRPPGAMERPANPRGQYIKYLTNVLISFMVIGFNTAIKQASRLMREERLRHALQEEKLQAELSFLKHQISPHFLMNTLNNIHALVDFNRKDAQSAIIRLSHMLRYLLYEKEDKKTSLKREIEFIQSYIVLMKMRFSDQLEVRVNVPVNIPAVNVPAFIFITILENAFKHGASPNKASFIHLDIFPEDQYLVFTCQNSKLSETAHQRDGEGGIGLVNTRKRLELCYGDRYIWETEEKEDTFTSTIKLPIYETEMPGNR